MSHIVEADWITDAGFRAVVIMTKMGHRCGYVGIPPTHPLYGVGYSEPSTALTFPAEEPIGHRGIISVLVAATDNHRASPDAVFDVHGSITYAAGSPDYPIESKNLWWFGYDCAHAGDARDLEQMHMFEDDETLRSVFADSEHGVIRTLAFCREQCESLAQQLIDRIK